MRKAAYILGTVCVVFSLAGAALKLNSWPGGGILLILFTTSFSIGAMPLYLISLSKVETEKAMQFAIKLCGFSFAVLQVGLLFFAQRWPGEVNMILAGGAGQIVFLAVYLFNMQKPEVKTKGVSAFAVLAMLILLALGGAGYDRVKDSEIAAEQYIVFEQKDKECALALNHAKELFAEINSRDSLNHNDSIELALLSNGIAMAQYVENLKREIILKANYGDANYPDSTGEIFHPLDKVTATVKMVGPDVANPTGEGLVLYSKLLKFRKDALPAGVPFTVPVSEGSEVQEQWAKDNFYHATILEALTRLTMVQIAVCSATNTAIETKAYIE